MVVQRDAGDASTTPVTVSGLKNATSISISQGEGFFFACAVLTGGSVECWGDNSYGELTSSSTAGSSSTPVLASGLSNVLSVAAGYRSACALLSSGAVACWGFNGEGELGNGTQTASKTPVAVSGIGNAVGITAGYKFFCALLSDGSVKCWGDNSYTELGNGSPYNGPQSCGAYGCAMTPVVVSGISGAKGVYANNEYACARLSNGSLDCWGDTTYGQFGNGTTSDDATPVASGFNNVSAFAGGRYAACALLANGSVQCSGDDGWGELGDGSNTSSLTPVSVVW